MEAFSPQKVHHRAIKAHHLECSKVTKVMAKNYIAIFPFSSFTVLGLHLHR